MAKNVVKGWKNVFRLIDITIEINFFLINWKNHFDRSILENEISGINVLMNGLCSTVEDDLGGGGGSWVQPAILITIELQLGI